MLVKGRQMVEILNRCHIACACLGNHDFGLFYSHFSILKQLYPNYIHVKDFGLDVLLTHIANSTFPWLLSNVLDADTKNPLGNVKDRLILDFNDIRVSYFVK